MDTKSHIAKWGDSLAVHIPKPIAEQWGVREGTVIEMSVRGDRVVMRKRGYRLADMLAEVNPDNLHAEQDAGLTQGAEA